MKEKEIMNVLFNDISREVLFSLVDREDPSGSAKGKDDVFEPTISSIFLLFDELMCENVPDLYQAEWLLIFKSLSSTFGVHRLPNSTEHIRQSLILSLEDLESNELYIVDSLELAKKLAGFSDLSLCAIYYQIQRAIVAVKRNQGYSFPKIKYKA